MHKFTPALLTLCVLCSAAAASAQMQSPAAPSPPAPPPTTTTTNPQTTATAPAGQPDFGQLMSSLNNMRPEIAKVQAMNGSSANNIRPVNVAQLNGANPSALSTAVSKNQAQVSQLRGTLSRVTVTTMTNEHITLAQFLADNKIGVGQVVAAHVDSGKIVLFYQKP